VRGYRYPLTHTQQGILFTELTSDGASPYCLTLAFDVTGPLPTSSIAATLDALARQHDLLRSVVSLDGAEPCGLVRDQASPDLAVLHKPSRVDVWTWAEETVAEHSREPFDLATALWRTRLLRIGENRAVLCFAFHELIADEWSLRVFLTDFAAMWPGSEDVASPHPCSDRLQYGDYAAWKQQFRVEDDDREHIERLRGFPPHLNLPRPSQVASGCGVERRTLAFDQSLATALREQAHAHGTTPFIVLLAAYAAVLGRQAHQAAITVAVPVSERDLPGTSEIIGNFVDVKVVPIDLERVGTFDELIVHARESFSRAIGSRGLSLQRLLEGVGATRGVARPAYVDAVLAFQTVPRGNLRLSGVEARSFAVRSASTAFDLRLIMTEEMGRFTGVLEFDPATLPAGVIERIRGDLLDRVGRLARSDHDRGSTSRTNGSGKGPLP
jgi:hypothetical protein